jgi:hypothetical protein
MSYGPFCHLEPSMIRSIIAAAALLSLGSPILAAPCRDAHGKFTKCTPPKSAPGARCRDAKGKFAKCGTPGAQPVGTK